MSEQHEEFPKVMGYDVPAVRECMTHTGQHVFEMTYRGFCGHFTISPAIGGAAADGHLVAYWPDGTFRYMDFGFTAAYSPMQLTEMLGEVAKLVKHMVDQDLAKLPLDDPFVQTFYQRLEEWAARAREQQMQVGGDLSTAWKRAALN